MFKPRFSTCLVCNKPALIVIKAGACKYCNEANKKLAKSNRVVKLVNKSEQLTSLPVLKKKLWAVFSEYIRKRDSKDETFTCISCHTLQSSKSGNLQAGHYYKSETYPALRYDETNVSGQCLSCNIFKEGNRQGYEIGLLKKYGPKVVHDLKIRCHNKANLGRFEMELLIKIYQEKLQQLESK